jgi:hypothetical protein
MEYLLWATTLKFSKITRSRYNRKTITLCLKHNEEDDTYSENDLCERKDIHREKGKNIEYIN